MKINRRRCVTGLICLAVLGLIVARVTSRQGEQDRTPGEDSAPSVATGQLERGSQVIIDDGTLPVVSPDGRVYFYRDDEVEGAGGIRRPVADWYSCRVDGSDVRKLELSRSYRGIALRPTFDATGTRLLLAYMDPERLRAGVTPDQVESFGLFSLVSPERAELIRGHLPLPPQAAFAPDWTKVIHRRSGFRAVVSTRAADGEIGEEIYAIGERPEREVLRFAWAPDSRRIALVIGAAGGEAALITLQLALGEEREVARIPYQIDETYSSSLSPLVWSPDGQWLGIAIAKLRRSDGALQLLEIRAVSVATGEAYTLPLDEAPVVSISIALPEAFAWTPDMQYFLYDRPRPAAWERRSIIRRSWPWWED